MLSLHCALASSLAFAYQPPVPAERLLIALVVLTLIAVAAQRFADSRRHKGLRRLAGQYGMHYAKADLFGFAVRLESFWPIPDCSGFRVVDVVYGSAAGLRRYVFTVHFALGPLDHHRRDQRVATCAEPCDGVSKTTAGLTLAERSGSLLEQYQRLLHPMDKT
jgi:hypothetical protein